MRKTWLSLITAALLLVSQCIVLAHAMEFGDHPHEHDEEPCAIVVMAADKDLAPTSNKPLVNYFRSQNNLSSVYKTTTCSINQSPLPPATGPPARAH